mmetsp:Transcript_203/g.550  ORF Transcript_203/g.550 Transcript_203/m.550 type:complete len:209 (-) Transcript_203:758-1384(-)
MMPPYLSTSCSACTLPSSCQAVGLSCTLRYIPSKCPPVSSTAFISCTASASCSSSEIWRPIPRLLAAVSPSEVELPGKIEWVMSSTCWSCLGVFSLTSFCGPEAHVLCSCKNSARHVVIFILFFGVRSPWRITASTARSSCRSQRSGGREYFFLVVLGAASCTTPGAAWKVCDTSGLDGIDDGICGVHEFLRPVTPSMCLRSTIAASS